MSSIATVAYYSDFRVGGTTTDNSVHGEAVPLANQFDGVMLSNPNYSVVATNDAEWTKFTGLRLRFSRDVELRGSITLNSIYGNATEGYSDYAAVFAVLSDGSVFSPTLTTAGGSPIAVVNQPVEASARAAIPLPGRVDLTTELLSVSTAYRGSEIAPFTSDFNEPAINEVNAQAYADFGAGVFVTDLYVIFGLGGGATTPTPDPYKFGLVTVSLGDVTLSVRFR